MEIIHFESVCMDRDERNGLEEGFPLVAIKIHEITFLSLNILQTFCILRLSESIRDFAPRLQLNKKTAR